MFSASEPLLYKKIGSVFKRAKEADIMDIFLFGFFWLFFFVIVVFPAPDGEESTILKPKTNPFLIY